MRNKADELDAISPGACGLVGVTELLSLLNLKSSSHYAVTAADVGGITTALANYGFGLEPDPRFAGPLPAITAKVVVFREPEAVEANRLDFLMARTEVEISALVAAKDGQIDPIESKEIVAKIKAFEALSNAAKVRLIAYLAYLVANPPSRRSIEKIGERNLHDREIVADAAFKTATRKGKLLETDVRFLERTFDRLNLPKKSLEQKIEALQTPLNSLDVPPLVKAGDRQSGIPIPPPQPKNVETSELLSSQLISRIRADTEKVSEILGEIFEREDDPKNQSSEETIALLLQAAGHNVSGGENDRFPGLEIKHANLLSEILESSKLDQNQFDILARKHGLMPSGAIELINEWSFERFEEPLLDGGGNIEIARHLIAPEHSDRIG